MIDQLENPPKCKTQLRERLKKKKKKKKRELVNHILHVDTIRNILN